MTLVHYTAYYLVSVGKKIMANKAQDIQKQMSQITSYPWKQIFVFHTLRKVYDKCIPVKALCWYIMAVY